MSADYEFRAEMAPSPELISQVAERAPENPFFTHRFAAARKARGYSPVVLAMMRDGEMETGCVSFLATGRVSCRLEIHSLPTLPAEDRFWEGLRRFCGEGKITELEVNTFGSTAARIPNAGRELWRRRRSEYVLDLGGAELWRGLSANHRRNLARARKAGVFVCQRLDADACRTHAELMASSMSRWQTRGEDALSEEDPAVCRAYVEHGAGELFQVGHGGQIVSSILVLTAPKGAYYHSAGTSDEGREVRASQFLIVSVAEQLRGRGCARFNLGGADEDQAGLVRFKSGFGTHRVDLEAAGFVVGSRVGRVVRSALGLVSPR